MTTMKGLEGKELVSNLRKLIISFEPFIRDAGSAEQLDEVLLHLEETDENFHRHEFVKILKKQINELLGPIIENEIEMCSTGMYVPNSGQETLVEDITERITCSKPFKDLRRALHSNINAAVEVLMDNFDKEFNTSSSQTDTPTQNAKKSQGFIDEEDSEYSTCDSSFKSSLMFMSHEYFQQVAENLAKTKPHAERVEALQTLCHSPPADVISGQCWSVLRKNLLDVLSDSDETLLNLSQKFFSRAFANTTHQTREIYTLLVEHLMGQFHSRKSIVPKLKNCLYIEKPEISRFLRLFRLMNDFQHETPGYWVRYQNRYLEEILESTLNLLSTCPSVPAGSPAAMTPVHFMALVDPKAKWFIKWMHGSYSRLPLLALMDKYKPIIEQAVQHCLAFCHARLVPFDAMSDISETFSRSVIADGKRSHYTGSELEYAYFVHSLSIIGRMMNFVEGRKFFPVKLKDAETPITITHLLVLLVDLIVDPGYHISSKSMSNEYEPMTLATEVLKNLCLSEQVCEICLCNDEVTNALLLPVTQYLESGENSDVTFASESTLLHVADILCMIASSTRGRRHLMYGQTKDARSKSAAAHVIAEFTRRALLGTLSQELCPPPSHAVIGAYLYICRQMYNTCEGLMALYPYSLHTCVSAAWKEAIRECEGASTPTPRGNTGAHSDPYKILAWEDTLIDNMLNFASTGKGLLLLQQTGALNECVSYMFSRYANKQQVSKCEKFGYGYMVTQVAGTVPGIVALKNSGYITALITELWTVLECGLSDSRVFTPKPWPVEPIDRSCHKHLIRLLNVLSAFPAVYELLSNQKMPNLEEYSFRDIPGCIVSLLDRIVLVDSRQKINSLFNYEESHLFGLRVLSVMASCLDTCLLLQTQYRFQDTLLLAQANNVPENSNKIIVDALSVERNRILVKSYVIGGPSEREIPPESIVKDKASPYPFPLFSSYPVPRDYVPNLSGKTAAKQENDLSRLLSDNKMERNLNWLEKCKAAFINTLIKKPEQLKGTVIQQLLEKALPVICQSREQVVFPPLQNSGADTVIKVIHLNPIQQMGVKMTIRYGVHLKVVATPSDTSERLSQLLKQCKHFLRQQQKTMDSPFRYLQGGYPGFDWFLATIFLMFHGNVEKTWKFLQKFSSLAGSGYLWLPRLHGYIHQPSDLMSSGIPLLLSSIGHNIEFILQTELPLVASAFKMSGLIPALISQHWLKQCFWNYLDWPDIGHYICLCVVLGIDYMVYMCVAVMKHLQRGIMQYMQAQELVIYLKENPIRGFHVSEAVSYMRELEKKFRKTILPELLDICKP